MVTRQDGTGPPLVWARNLVLYGLLLVLSLIFFALVRNNTFWHSGDFLYLEQAIQVGRSWQQIFVSAPYQPFQPLVRLLFYVEFHFFALDPVKYYLFNIVVHSLNAFLVYFLVFTLLRDRTIAVLSSVLFACAVGNYGKAVMVVSGISDLVITMLTLLTLLFYFKNELEKGGRLLSFWFAASLVCFVLSLMTKATSFSILGSMVAFNVFFHSETKKPVLHRNFLVITVAALLALALKLTLLPDVVTKQDFVFNIFTMLRNVGSYLVRMVFPIHGSYLVQHAGPVVQFIYRLATEIRVVTFLCILSYSIFGFIFGNRTIRFFIAWTYITVVPFCMFRFPDDWLNIRYLYLVSVGFIMLLASATVLASRLLYQKAWRRFLPYALPVIFIFLSQFIVYHLDTNYERKAMSPDIQQLKERVMREYDESQKKK
jgi:hypothetical protein